MNYLEAVNLFLDKYYHPAPWTDRVHLFPSLAPPVVSIDEDGRKVSLYSPDNYADVYFTTDGTDPGLKTNIYKVPLELNNSRVIKAACIDTYGNASDCVTIIPEQYNAADN
jgi:hypothetical protein